MREQQAIKLYNGITALDEELLAEAQRDAPRKSRRAPGWVKWGAAAACLCLIAGAVFALFGPGGGAHRVLQWSARFQPGDYFQYSAEGDEGSSQSTSIADTAIPYAETRDFSGQRQQLEAENAIPTLDSHPLFDCAAHYNADGSLAYMELSWHRRGEMTDYSDLKIIAGPKEVPLIEDCIAVEVDAQGNILAPAVTVTERDGIRIVAEGREDQNKKLTFQTADGWYQLSASWNDDYDTLVMLLDWLWAHPLDLSRFPIEAGDCYVNTSLAEYPAAFADALPDFEAFGWVTEETYLQLKNGTPVRFEGHYVAHVEPALVAAGAYSEVPGHTKMHWCLNAEPDVYDLQRSVGSLDGLTEAVVREALSQENSIAFTWGELFVLIYPDSPDEAWTLIASLQD